MKVFKIILIAAFVIIALGFIAVAIFVSTFDVMRFKPQIIEQANKALARQVDFEKAGLAFSFTQGIAVKIENLAISEDPIFGKDKFLSIKYISAGIDAAALIFKKEISIPTVVIDSAVVVLIRNKDGVINAQTIAQAPKTALNSYDRKDIGGTAQENGVPIAYANPAATPANILQDKSSQAMAALPKVLVSDFQIKNSTVKYIDQTFGPAVNFELNNLAVRVKKFSLTDTFPFEAQVSVLSSAQNIKVQGNVLIDLKTISATITDLTASTELSQLILDKIPQSLPMLKSSQMPSSLNADVRLGIEKLTVSAGGLSEFNAVVSLKDAGISLKEIALPLSAGAADIKLTKEDITFDKVSFALGTGTVKEAGTIKDYIGGQDFNIESEINSVKVQEVINQEQSVAKVEGEVSGKIICKGKGFTPENIKSNLSCKADISIIKAMLKGVNVLRQVLDKIAVIPGLSNTIEAGLPERFKEKLTQKNTRFSDIKLPLTIENGRIVLADTAIEAEEFVFQGTGEAGFDSSYSLQGGFFISQDLSASMVSSVPQLKYLLDEKGRVYLPLMIFGQAGNQVQFSINADYIAKKLLENQAKQQILKALDKALGREDPANQNPNPVQDQQSEQQDQGSSAQESVKDILRGIFQ
jgi:uncharacterized protein involved in outer membrane biogenesis